MICMDGDVYVVDSLSVFGWLFGGVYFSCGDWEMCEVCV